MSDPWWKVLCFFPMVFLQKKKALYNDNTKLWEMWFCRWKDVKHDNTVTWLAFWNDPINPKEFKYVFLAASSAMKGLSDKEKYEKARNLTVNQSAFIVFWSLCLRYYCFSLLSNIFFSLTAEPHRQYKSNLHEEFHIQGCCKEANCRCYLSHW